MIKPYKIGQGRAGQCNCSSLEGLSRGRAGRSAERLLRGPARGAQVRLTRRLACAGGHTDRRLTIQVEHASLFRPYIAWITYIHTHTAYTAYRWACTVAVWRADGPAACDRRHKKHTDRHSQTITSSARCKRTYTHMNACTSMAGQATAVPRWLSGGPGGWLARGSVSGLGGGPGRGLSAGPAPLRLPRRLRRRKAARAAARLKGGEPCGLPAIG